MLIMALTIVTPVYGASVPPQTIPGDDSNPNDFQPSKGCIHHEISNSDNNGTHTIKFNTQGQVDPNGPFEFTIVVGTVQGESFTKILSWTSNFPVQAVIVKGGPAFNLYSYGTDVRGDTNLASPTIPSDNPADISHVSVVICPDEFPPPTEPTCATEPCPAYLLNGNCINMIGIIVIFVLLIIAFLLLGLLLGSKYCCHVKCLFINIDKCKKCRPKECDKDENCNPCRHRRKP